MIGCHYDTKHNMCNCRNIVVARYLFIVFIFLDLSTKQQLLLFATEHKDEPLCCVFVGYGEGYTEIVMKGTFEDSKFLALYIK